MKVQEVMKQDVKACFPDTNLATASALMWEHDCGILPVIVEGQTPVGVITDRDIALAVGTRARAPQDVRVDEVIHGPVIACTPDDDVHAALKIMRKEKVRRLPVVTDDGVLRGILSLNDLVLHAQKSNKDLDYEDVVSTFKAICEHPHTTAATAAKTA
ncbi:MAG TPA: CBS domain-containing protein [Blastocatellia bacterium]|nr:CBS domain-containing protein [Blastocatellia bacterium]